jgi:hypothetical protein
VATLIWPTSARAESNSQSAAATPSRPRTSRRENVLVMNTSAAGFLGMKGDELNLLRGDDHGRA